jgi:hypothetical protein
VLKGDAEKEKSHAYLLRLWRRSLTLGRVPCFDCGLACLYSSTVSEVILHIIRKPTSSSLRQSHHQAIQPCPEELHCQSDCPEATRTSIKQW